jgi:translocation and assembly module TamA
MPNFQNKRPRRFATMLSAPLLALFAASAGAEVEVEISGVSDDVARNILAYLSIERYKNSDDLSLQMVERLQERIEREVRAAMKPFGFYEPKVTSVVRPEDGEDYRVFIQVTQGEPVLIENVEVNVTGPGASDPLFTRITGDMPLRPGERLNHSTYESFKGSLLRTASTFGWLDARMTRNEMLVDPQGRTARIHIDFETGEQYLFGETTIEQDAIDERLARRFLRYRPGQKYDATELLRTQFALDDSQYFSTVEVLPEDRDRETLTVPIDITAEPNRPSRYQFGVGYGTDTEVRGTVSWENRLVNPRGHRFRTELKAAALEQSIDARYIVPIGDPATEKFTLQLSGLHDRQADTDNRDINFTPSYTHVRGPWFGKDWQRVTYIELLQTRTDFTATGLSDRQTLLIPGMSFSLVPRNYIGEALFSRALYAEVRGSNEALGSDADFLQIRLQAERAFDLDDARKWHLLLRGNLGATALAKTSGLAPSQRFFAGGDRSVRGFGKDDLSPVTPVVDPAGNPVLDEDGVPRTQKLGGKHLITASAEVVRDLPWRNLSIAVFGDVGNAVDQFDDPLMYSVGLGLRLRLPVVSVGIDVAQALTTPAGETSRPGPRLHLNFSPKL